MKTNIIAPVPAPPLCPSGRPLLRQRRTHLPHTAPPLLTPAWSSSRGGGCEPILVSGL